MTLHLLGVPAKLFGELRRYHFEVRRELRLLAMTAPEDYPLATGSPTSSCRPTVSAAPARGSAVSTRPSPTASSRSTSTTRCPLTTPATMARIRDLLNEVYQEFSSDHLLALRPPEVLVDLQVWYFTEFERQGRGEAPKRWDGPTSMPTIV